MTEKPENPHIYPQSDAVWGGMTLRDYFAATILPRMIDTHGITTNATYQSYKMADLMLAERSTKRE